MDNYNLLLSFLYGKSYFFIFLFKIILIKEIKICICTIGKKENLYAKEYTNYYKKLGIDKIIIYDNNEIKDEKFDLVLKDYIDNKFVEIIDIRGKDIPQDKVFEDCRKNNFKKFDWILFYDMDEFLFLKNYTNIKDYLNQKHFNKCQRIQLNWFIHTDNNLIYYDKRQLKERFPDKKYIMNGKKLPGSRFIKSILKGNIDQEIKDVHQLNPKLVACNGFGKLVKLKGMKTNETDHYYYYIDHYWSKSTEEFVNKLMKGNAVLRHNLTKIKNNNLLRIKMYFTYNRITKEKIEYIEKKTKYNLTKYRKRIK